MKTSAASAERAWGVEPVPDRLRLFSFADTAALWGNLGISLLLPIVAAFMGLSFLRSLGAIAVGAVIGNAALGYAGRIGARTRAPAMVLYRAPLGRAGSYAPTTLNVLQNVGWGSFEILIIAAAAGAISQRLFDASLRPLWTILFGAAVTAMAVWGPLTVTRKWLKRYAVWAVLASSAYLTFYVLTHTSLDALLGAKSGGGTFWGGVDLVIAMPISWVPLVQDYTRFTRSPRHAFWGTGVGYGLAQVWFYALGVLLVLSGQAADPTDPNAFVAAVLAIPAGLLALGILAVDETDEAFANVYSAAVSIQNALPRLDVRWLAAGVGAVCTALALVVDLVQYESFLLLIGAVFVPLFGVLAADYAVVRRGYADRDLYGPLPWFRPWAAVAWVAGFLAYNWVNPGQVAWWGSAMKKLFGGLGLPAASEAAPWLGASIASFAVAFLLQATARAWAGNRAPTPKH